MCLTPTKLRNSSKTWSLSLVIEGLGAIYIRQRHYAADIVFKSLKRYTSANTMRHFIFIHRLYLKKRYATHYGELILPEEHSYAVLVPSWDPSRRIKMAYTDSIAYMLYSSGIKADKLKMLIDRYECILYNGGTIIDASLYEDINRVPRNAICHYANQFDKIVTAMDELKKGNFVFMEGD